MLSAYKYRIYPSSEQEVRLNRSLLSLCNLYNKLRAEKIVEYKQSGISLTRTALRRLALQERRNTAELSMVYSQVAQNVADRVYDAFVNFLEGRARFPKEKRHEKYCSITYPQAGFRLDSERLCLSKVGEVRIFKHRPIHGRVKRLAVKREADGWYAIFTTKRAMVVKQPVEGIATKRIRGADVGLENFATLDNGKIFVYPRYLISSESRVKELQGKLSHKKRNSKRWRRLCLRLARLHLHVKRQREDWQNKQVSELFASADVVVLERLNIEGMMKNHHLAKSISDAAWGKFARKAIFKADSLGKRIVAVDPWGTTQFCHNCLTWVPKGLSDRFHRCPKCGITISRDLNSSRLIRKLGIQSCPPSDGGSSLAEPKPLPSLRGVVSRGDEAGSPIS